MRYVEDAHRIGSRDGKFDPEKIEVSRDLVALRKDEISEEVKHGDIVIPTKTIAGFKGATGTVIALGDDAKKDYGLEIGDRVKFDDVGVFYDTYPIVILKAENCIVKVDPEDSDIHIPLKNMVFAKSIDTVHSMGSDSSIIISSKHNQAEVGEVFMVDNEDVVKVGDKILIMADGDRINSKDGEYLIYKQDEIPAIIED